MCKVLFCHGWPESWFCWRAQLAACAAAGFRCIAPDMRGYGGTSAPQEPEEYNIATLCGDALALINHVGHQKAVVVGHDWGADFVWKLAALHPDVVTAVCAMSVPYDGRTRPLLSNLKKAFGDPFLPNAVPPPQFFYMLHHNLPEAAAEYDRDVRASLLMLYNDQPPATAAGEAAPHGWAPPEVPPEVTDLYVGGAAKGMVARLPRPPGPPAWMAEAGLEHHAGELERHGGFAGGLNWWV